MSTTATSTSPGTPSAASAPAPASGAVERPSGSPTPPPRPKRRKKRRSIATRVEAYISKLASRNNFWNRVCSLIWLPYAFRSGIRMKRIDPKTFAAVLPFRRFNRNWYNAMAGAALVGNSEIAGGMYVFGVAGADYTVVCKHLNYKFLRPCYGPAIYRITPRETIEDKLADGGEFNITLELDVVQQITKPGGREKRVGRCDITFHVTPKTHHKERKARRQKAEASAASSESKA